MRISLVVYQALSVFASMGIIVKLMVVAPISTNVLLNQISVGMILISDVKIKMLF